MYTVFSGSDNVSKVINVPIEVELIKAESSIKNTIIIDKAGRENLIPLIFISDIQEMDKHNKLINYLLGKPKIISIRKKEENTPMQQEVVIAKKKEPEKEDVGETTAENRKEMIVTIKHVKTTLDGFYSNVFVNKRKILSNHINTKIKLFGNGVILAVHCIVTDNVSFPKRPIWMVYDTDLKLRIPVRKEAFSGYNVQVMNIGVSGNKLCLDLTNRSKMFLDIERIRNKTENKLFVFKEEKTK